MNNEAEQNLTIEQAKLCAAMDTLDRLINDVAEKPNHSREAVASMIEAQAGLLMRIAQNYRNGADLT
jgi:hypothetical protein